MHRISRARVMLAALFQLFAVPPLGAGEETLFPRPSSLAPAVAFWTRVYTEVETEGGFVHDDRRLEVVYETLRFEAGTSPKDQDRSIDKAIERYRSALLALAKGKRKNLSREERRALEAWRGNASNERLEAAARRVRFQRGQANRFRGGLERAGAWSDYIGWILTQRGLPVELAVLPHVESSFNPLARSHAGAAGLWQFTRTTGVRFLRIDDVVDERIDVYRSTQAAAQLLQHNFSVLESWPLAITAYNHGLSGMRRAVRATNSEDIGAIVQRYQGRRFRFASRNFYAAFLAALDVAKDAEHYFGDLVPHCPDDHPTVKLPAYIPVAALAQGLGVDPDTLRELNPALQRAVWEGTKYVPMGYRLRLPRAFQPRDSRVRIERIAVLAGTDAQKRDRVYKVCRGDTLSEIAERYGTTTRELLALNQLRSRHRIRVGQTLRLPGVRAPEPVRLTALNLDRDPPMAEVGLADTLWTHDGIFATITDDGLNGSTLLRVAANPARRDCVYPGEAPVMVARVKAAEDGQVAQTVEVTDPSQGAQPFVVAQTADPSTLDGVEPASVEAVGESPESEVPRLALLEMPVLRPLLDASLLAVDPVFGVALVESETSEGSVELAGTEPKARVSVAKGEGVIAQAARAPAAGPMPAETQPELAADPADYQVAANETIEVQVAETLGHYADWLELHSRQLRRLNGLRSTQLITVGERIKLDFARVSPREFEGRRVEYHRSHQAEFFERHRINGVCEHTVRPDDSLWTLALQDYEIPLWLLRQYNPDVDFDSVLPLGGTVRIPLVEPLAGDAGPAPVRLRATVLSCRAGTA